MPKRPKQVEGVYEKNPGSGVWYTRLRVNGRLVRKAIGTHSEAIAYVEKARTLRRTSEGVGQTAVRSFAEIEKVDSGTTINELCDLYLGHIPESRESRTASRPGGTAVAHQGHPEGLRGSSRRRTEALRDQGLVDRHPAGTGKLEPL